MIQLPAAQGSHPPFPAKVHEARQSLPPLLRSRKGPCRPGRDRERAETLTPSMGNRGPSPSTILMFQRSLEMFPAHLGKERIGRGPVQAHTASPQSRLAWKQPPGTTCRAPSPEAGPHLFLSLVPETPEQVGVSASHTGCYPSSAGSFLFSQGFVGVPHLSVGPGAHHLVTLCLGFPICEMESAILNLGSNEEMFLKIFSISDCLSSK